MMKALPITICDVRATRLILAAALAAILLLSIGSALLITPRSAYSYDQGIPCQAGPPIIFDAASSASAESVNSLTWPHTVGSGVNRILIVGITNNGFIVQSVSYGGLPLTEVFPKQSITVRAETWYLINPPIGTANIVVISGNIQYLTSFAAGGASYFNVDQTMPISDSKSSSGPGSGTNGGVTGSIPIVNIQNACGHVLVDTVAIGGGSAVPASGQTQRWSASVSGLFGAGSERESPGLQMSWNPSGSYYWSQSAISIKPSTPCEPSCLPNIAFSPSAGPSGTIVTVTGCCWSTLDTNVTLWATGVTMPDGSSNLWTGPASLVCPGSTTTMPDGSWSGCITSCSFTVKPFAQVGAHTVVATGTVGDTTTATFTVQQPPPGPLIQQLINTVNGLGLPNGVRQSLTAPLSQAVNLLTDNNPNNDGAVCGKLTAFLNQVSAKLGNGQLTAAQAQLLSDQANAIKTSLGC